MINQQRAARGLLDWFGNDEPVVDRATLLPIGQYDDGSLTFAWPGFLKDAWDGAQRSYLDSAGVQVPDTADGRKWSSNVDALNAASVAPIGTLGARGLGLTNDVGDLGMFAGRGAKTADHAKLSQAERMAADGAPREQIWTDTGWFQGADKQWRFEIDDSASAFNPRTGTVGSALDHGSLYRAYPGMESYPLTIKQSTDGSSGSFLNQSIEMTPEAGRSTLLHELQHGIQNSEGFARGGNHYALPKSRYDEVYGRVVAPVQLEVDGLRTRQKQLLGQLNSTYSDAKAKSWFGGPTREASDRRASIQKELNQLDGQISDARTRVRAAEDGIRPELERMGPLSMDDIHNYYKSLAGETEARAVQAREHLTPMQRAERAPWLDYDVPEAEQVLRFANPDTAALPAIFGHAQSQEQPTNSLLASTHPFGPQQIPQDRNSIMGPGYPGRDSWDLFWENMREQPAPPQEERPSPPRQRYLATR